MDESVVSWRLLEDVLGWAAVLVGATIIHFTAWWWIDALLAMAIAAFILTNIVRRLWEIGRLFLQVVPDEIDVAVLRNAITGVEGVRDVHHLHVWSLDGERHVATIGDAADAPSVKEDIRRVLSQHEFEHVTIEIDLGGDCSLSGR